MRTASTGWTSWATRSQPGNCTLSSATSSKSRGAACCARHHHMSYFGSSCVMQRLVLVSLAAVVLLASVSTAALAQGGRPGAPPPPPPPPPASATGAGTGGGAAQTSTVPTARIAYVNLQEVLRRTPGYVAAESTYRKLVTGYQGELQRLQQQLDSAVQAFDQQSIALSPAARQTKQKDLQTMQQRMEQRTNELQDRARQREQELLQPIQARVTSVIQGIRAESNYSLILDADAAGGLIAAADPALNITARVLQRLSQAQ